jgi:nondiscriminating glutamyl-tRNA synthetase
LGEVLAFPLESPEAAAIQDDPQAMDLIRAFGDALKGHEGLTLDEFRAVLAVLKKETGAKGRQLFHPLRVALTARDSGPELDKLIPLVETGARLGVRGVVNCRTRVEAFLSRYGKAVN